MAQIVDLAWRATQDVDLGNGTKGKPAAIWHLPDGRPGYVDVYNAGALEAVIRGSSKPRQSERLGRWVEDAYTKNAFTLARQGGVQQAALGREAHRARQRVYSATSYPIGFTAEGAALLDRATTLITRSVLTGQIAAAAEDKTKNDKAFDPGASQEQSQEQAKQDANAASEGVNWSRILLYVGAGLAAAAAVVLL